MEYQKEKEQKILEEEKKLSPVFNLVNKLKDKEGIKKEENSIVNLEDNKKEEISKIEEIKEDKKEEIISEKKDVATSTNNETKTQNETSNINSNSKKEETTKTTESLTFVKLINVAKIKGDLNKKYFDKGLSVLGFPCNQFLSQEPGTEDEIKEFCSLTYGVEFEMFSKIDVNGENAHPLYKFLKESSKGVLGTEAIKWNFTKFLVDRAGKVVGRYASTVSPNALTRDIEKLL